MEAFGLSTLLSGFLSATWGKCFFISAASGAIGSSQIFSVGVPWDHQGFIGVCGTEGNLFCLILVYPIVTGSRTVDWRQNLYSRTILSWNQSVTTSLQSVSVHFILFSAG